MIVLDSEQIRARVSMPQLIEALRNAFAREFQTPPRQLMKVPGGQGDRLLLSMPAFAPDGAATIKLASVFPDNAARGIPTIHGAIVVFSAHGAPTAVLDGGMVTKLRTAAASALASTYLSRADSANLVIFGTGALAPYMAQAHCAARPVRKIRVCGRNEARVAETVASIRALVGPADVQPASSPQAAVADADIVSCATSAESPVVQGAWLKPGAFLDLVGSFSPHKRECDDDAVRRARLFVDTFEGAMSEAGDLLDPLERGIIRREQIEAELADLVAGRTRGRTSPQEITLFKSVGTAIEDMAAAQLIVGLG